MVLFSEIICNNKEKNDVVNNNRVIESVILKTMCMEDKNKAFRIGLMVVVALLGLASILSAFIEEGISGLMNYSLGAGICFALSEGFALKRQKYTWLYPLILWVVLVSVSLFLKLRMAVAGILTDNLFVPYVLVLIIRHLPIKEIYKETLYLGFLPFLAFRLVGQWGNNAIVMAIAFVTLPAFYYVTRNSNVKERWNQLVIFLLPTLFTHVFGYFPFVAPRLLALVLSLLVVMLIRALHVSRKAKAVTLVLLMIFSLPLSFLLSANLFTYLVANEYHSKVKEPFPFSYTFISKEGDMLTESNLKGKNVAVFFWSSHCANCHKELPLFSELAAQYEGDTTKVFIAAFISFDEASDSAFYASETSRESAFTWAKALDSKQVMQDLGFNAFPHVTYINKEGNVVYNGFLSNRPWIFAYHPRKFLEL